MTLVLLSLVPSTMNRYRERILRSREVAAWVGWPGRKRPTAPETAKGMLSERPKAREAGDYDVTYE